MRWRLDRLELFERDDWTCVVCGRPLTSGVPQLAHRIGQTVGNLRQYGKRVIHHPANLASVCSLECNSAVDITRIPTEVDRVLAIIYDDIGGSK
jgi:5-methylcytosine-specific restriction endonuclease McrA